MKNRIKVIGNGNQVPFGIGEYIADFSNTKAGLAKAIKLSACYYNKPTITLPDNSLTDDIEVTNNTIIFNQ